MIHTPHKINKAEQLQYKNKEKRENKTSSDTLSKVPIPFKNFGHPKLKTVLSALSLNSKLRACYQLRHTCKNCFCSNPSPRVRGDVNVYSMC